MDSAHSQPSVPVDTPSPVDLSIPPPPPPLLVAPAQEGRAMEDKSGVGDQLEPQQLTPLTPGVVMKLGPFGPASSTPAKATTKAKGKKSDAKPGKEGSNGLKQILPGTCSPLSVSLNHSFSYSGLSTLAGASSISPAGPQPSEPVGPVKKVSHKDAEQKRRDSQKTAYDELRRLLPPITFEDDDEQPILGNEPKKKKDEVIPVRGPLPPGALPPRGPPKAGGDGPNKGVSKLQLLICGNQYIRTLKGRVERRDEEIAKLRREVGRLRRKKDGLEAQLAKMSVGTGMHVDAEVDEDDDEVELDLEADLDAVEGMGVYIGLVGEGEEDGED